jgi:hypothetical protein
MIGFERAEEKAFDLSPTRPPGVQSRRQNRGIVAKECIAGAQELRQIGEQVMGDASLRAIHHQQTRLIPPRRRRLRDQMRRQRVIKKIGGKRHSMEWERTTQRSQLRTVRRAL